MALRACTGEPFSILSIKLLKRDEVMNKAFIAGVFLGVMTVPAPMMAQDATEKALRERITFCDRDPREKLLNPRECSDAAQEKRWKALIAIITPKTK